MAPVVRRAGGERPVRGRSEAGGTFTGETFFFLIIRQSHMLSCDQWPVGDPLCQSRIERYSKGNAACYWLCCFYYQRIMNVH